MQEVVGGDVLAGVLGYPGTQQREELLVADRQAQCVQGQCSALVDAVVEHVLGAGVGQEDVLRRILQLGVVAQGVTARVGAAGELGPQPFGVAGEALVQPDVLPLDDGDGVAEPLVRELVGDQAFVVGAGFNGVAAERGHAHGLERDLQFVVGHHDLVVVERVRPEQVAEHVDHLELPVERLAEAALEVGGQVGADRDLAAADLEVLVLAEIDGDEIGGGGVREVELPGGHASAALLADESAGHHRAVGRVGGEPDAERGLGGGVVVAGEPAGCAVGLTCYQDTVGEFFPADLAPGSADGARVSGVPDGQGESFAHGEGVGGGHGELAAGTGVAGDAAAVHRHLGDVQVRGEVEVDGREGLGGGRGDHGYAAEVVGTHLVGEVQLVAGDAVSVVAGAGQVGVDGVGARGPARAGDRGDEVSLYCLEFHDLRESSGPRGRCRVAAPPLGSGRGVTTTTRPDRRMSSGFGWGASASLHDFSPARARSGCPASGCRRGCGRRA